MASKYIRVFEALWPLPTLRSDPAEPTELDPSSWRARAFGPASALAVAMTFLVQDPSAASEFQALATLFAGPDAEVTGANQAAADFFFATQRVTVPWILLYGLREFPRWAFSRLGWPDEAAIVARTGEAVALQSCAWTLASGVATLTVGLIAGPSAFAAFRDTAGLVVAVWLSITLFRGSRAGGASRRSAWLGLLAAFAGMLAGVVVASVAAIVAIGLRSAAL